MELARQLEEPNNSLCILECNQSESNDAVFKALGNIENKMIEGFKIMGQRLLSWTQK